MLEITVGAERDLLRVEGAFIPGENLLARTCAFLRGHFGVEAVPPLEMKLSKFLPMGSGVGAGSGNSAAFLRWFMYFSGHALPDLSEIGKLGADVAFLASPHDLALADGIGDRLEGLDGGLELPGVILFPRWSSDTRDAYAHIDRLRDAPGAAENIPTPEEARDESLDILKRLRDRRCVGLLPNDFLLCCDENLSCYNDAYAAFEESGALAWGLCGSGSSCFALFASREDLAKIVPSRFGRFRWLRKIMLME